MTNRRSFLKNAGLATAAGATALAAPAVTRAQSKITWRLQTYAGPALAEYVIKPSIDNFNKAANGEMEIQLFTADQLVPTGELFRAMQQGTIDAVQSDDDSMNSPLDIKVFGGYFPFATQSKTLFKQRLGIFKRHLNRIAAGTRIIHRHGCKLIDAVRSDAHRRQVFRHTKLCSKIKNEVIKTVLTA